MNLHDTIQSNQDGTRVHLSKRKDSSGYVYAVAACTNKAPGGAWGYQTDRKGLIDIDCPRCHRLAVKAEGG
jgi:hypothetical protein